ncbi:NADPH oxidase organizer 1b [Pygocentrus nattereri]|uniref:NADPH oxidase organizer 1b n=1 Tax=Pygocentrus nattereri TaxID=42514 RepID=A0A3B4BWJ4_PYGNA|nr:NADPH oxidase organizer 1b [Pygocentrus nattereri]
MGDSRFPVSVRIIGIIYKDKSKLYMVSVLWSDQNEVVVYRSLGDFKKFHRQLKKKFQVDSPFGKRGRVLPRFGGRMPKVRLQKRTPARSVHRVNALQNYCTDLLQCDPSITQATDIFQFFLPNEQELLPEFVQNSVMVLQSNGIPGGHTGSDSANRHLNVGNVTQPFITKTYRCVAPYETKDTKNRPFKVAVDETLDVIIKDQAGWWLVENEEKRLAWFPAPYLELCEEEEEEEDELDMVVERYCAVRSYTSKTKDELSVTIGTILEVLQKPDNGWWLARYNGKAGYVPSMYLQPYTSPTFSLQKKLHNSTLNLSTTSTLLQEISYTTEPQVRSARLKSLHKSLSVEVLSEPLAEHSAQVQRSNSDSRKSVMSGVSDETNFSFSSSSTLGLSSSEGEETLRQAEKDPEADSSDSGLSDEQPSTTSRYSKLGPRVPPRPQTQEILTRCTTFTRKAALATQAHLFPERIGNESQAVGRD